MKKLCALLGITAVALALSYSAQAHKNSSSPPASTAAVMQSDAMVAEDTAQLAVVDPDKPIIAGISNAATEEVSAPPTAAIAATQAHINLHTLADGVVSPGSASILFV